MIEFPIPNQVNKQHRIFSDSTTSEKGIRASDSRWSWLGRSIKYKGTDHQDYFLNRTSAKAYLKRHGIKVSHLSDSKILTKLAELNPNKKEEKIPEQKIQKSPEIQTAESGKGNDQVAIGEKHLMNKEYDKAIAIFTPLAQGGEKGNTIAQYHLGNHYLYGVGVDYDFQKAIRNLLFAALKGHADAQNQIGNIHSLNGNDKEAFKFYSLSAQQGNADAQNNLGTFYKIVNKDDKEAFKYYQLAADQNQTNALWNIAYMYEHGLGVDKNLEKAFEYYQRNSKSPDPNFSVNRKLGNMYELGQGIKKDDKEAFRLYKLARESKDTHALPGISRLYQQGRISQEDLDVAKKFHNEFLNMQGSPIFGFHEEIFLDSTSTSHWAHQRNLNRLMDESGFKLVGDERVKMF